MNKYILFLVTLFLIFTGCAKQTSSIDKMKSTVVISKADNFDKFIKVLPEGTYAASVMKRTYVYPTLEDEKREQELEKKFREEFEEELEKETMPPMKTLKRLYNKDTDFRDNIDPVINYILDTADEEDKELKKLFDSAKEKVIEDKKIDLNIKKDGEKIIITTSAESTKFLDSLTIDFSDKKPVVSKGSFNEVDLSKDEQRDYALEKPEIKINNEELKPLFIWYHSNNPDIAAISVNKLAESKKIVIRYLFREVSKNKFTEDILLINKIGKIIGMKY